MLADCDERTASARRAHDERTESSWCTKTTDSSTAVETPIISGTTLLRSAHLNETHVCSPPAPTVRSAASNALYSRLRSFCKSEKERVTTAGFLFAPVSLSLI